MKSNHNDLDLYNLPNLIHQAALDPYQDLNDLNEICDASKHFDFGGICTSLTQIPLIRERMRGKSKTKVIGVISFPFGSDPISIKKAQAEWSADEGADELEMVPNFFHIAQGNFNAFAEEIATICEIGLPVRVILSITNIEINKLSSAIEASIDAGVSGLQNGNGFGRPVTPTDIIQVKSFVKGRCSIKAVGGIKKLVHCIELIEAGANFIGTSSGKEILEEFRTREK